MTYTSGGGMQKIEFDNLNKVHFVGIGGSAISAVARLLLKNGIKVTGSDAAKSAGAEVIKL